MSSANFEIRVCNGPTCAGIRNADEVHEALLSRLEARPDDAPSVQPDRTTCFGRCLQGPNVHVKVIRKTPPDPQQPLIRSALYHGVQVEDLDEILESHIARGEVVKRLAQPPAPSFNLLDHLPLAIRQSDASASGQSDALQTPPPPASEPASANIDREPENR